MNVTRTSQRKDHCRILIHFRVHRLQMLPIDYTFILLFLMDLLLALYFGLMVLFKRIQIRICRPTSTQKLYRVLQPSLINLIGPTYSLYLLHYAILIASVCHNIINQNRLLITTPLLQYGMLICQSCLVRRYEANPSCLACFPSLLTM